MVTLKTDDWPKTWMFAVMLLLQNQGSHIHPLSHKKQYWKSKTGNIRNTVSRLIWSSREDMVKFWKMVKINLLRTYTYVMILRTYTVLSHTYVIHITYVRNTYHVLSYLLYVVILRTNVIINAYVRSIITYEWNKKTIFILSPTELCKVTIRVCD